MPSRAHCNANRTALTPEDCEYPNCSCEELPRKQTIGPALSRDAYVPPEPALDGLHIEERLIYLLGDMAQAFENFYGAECPKRGGFVNIFAKRILDNVVLLAGRERVAFWMWHRHYATGHGDTIEDLLGELEAQARQRALNDAAALFDRWAEANLKDAVWFNSHGKPFDGKGARPTGDVKPGNAAADMVLMRLCDAAAIRALPNANSTHAKPERDATQAVTT
jgi:hypothetical protein